MMHTTLVGIEKDERVRGVRQYPTARRKAAKHINMN